MSDQSVIKIVVDTERESIKNIIKSLTTKNQVKDLITKAS